MTKEEVILKVQEFANLPNRKDIIKLIDSIPKPSNIKFTPNDIKKGDIYYSGQLGHHLVVYKVNKEDIVCLMITTNGKIPCNSRFVKTTFSLCIIGCTLDQMSSMNFSGVYGNNRHLNLVYKELKTLL